MEMFRWRLKTCTCFKREINFDPYQKIIRSTRALTFLKKRVSVRLTLFDFEMFFCQHSIVCDHCSWSYTNTSTKWKVNISKFACFLANMEWKRGKIDVSMRSLQMDQLHTKPNKFVELRHSQSVFFFIPKRARTSE